MDISKYIETTSFARPSEKPKGTERRDDIKLIESRLIPMAHPVSRPAQVTSLSSHSSTPGPASLSPNSLTNDIAYETEKLIEKIQQIGKTYIEKVYIEIKTEKIELMEKVFDAIQNNKLYNKKCPQLGKILKENTAGFTQEEYLKALLGHDIPDVAQPFNLFFRLMQKNYNMSLTTRDLWLDWLSQPTDPVYKYLLSQVIRIKGPKSKSLLEWSSNTDAPRAHDIKDWIKKIIPEETFENLPEESDLSSPISVDIEEDIQAFPSRISHTDIKLTPKTHSSQPLNRELLEKVRIAIQKNKLNTRRCLPSLGKILEENKAGFNQEEYLQAYLLSHDVSYSDRPFNLFFEMMEHYNLTVAARNLWLDWFSQPTGSAYKSLLLQVISIKDPRNKKSLLAWSGSTDSTKARHIKAWIKKVFPEETFENLPKESEIASSMTSVSHHQINPRKRRRNHHQIGFPDKQKKRQKKPISPEDYKWSLPHGDQPAKETPELLPQTPENPGSADILNPLSSRISATDLIKIRKRGKKDQWAILLYFDELTTLGFTSHQIIRIAIRDGGANNLAAVPRHFSQLTKLGFTITQIVQMVSHTGGSLNLKTVCRDFQEFKVLGFTHDHLVRIVAHDGGSNNLQKVKDCFGSLSHLGHKIIVRMAAHIGGSKNLQAFLDESASLLKSGFNQDQIIGMASHIGGSKNLKTVIRHFDILRQWEFTHDQIAKIASISGGSKNIETVINYRKELELLKLGPTEIVRMVSHKGGSKNLQSFITARKALIQSGFTPEQIFNLAICRSGSKNIKAVLDSLNSLKAMDFNLDQIVRLTACDHGALNIADVKAHAENFRKYKFTPALILGLSDQRGRLRIQAIQQAFQSRSMLPELKQNLDQFLQSLSQSFETEEDEEEEEEEEIKSAHISPTEETLEEGTLELEEDFTQELDSWLKLWSKEPVVEQNKELQAGRQRFGVFPAPTPPQTPQKSQEAAPESPAPEQSNP